MGAVEVRFRQLPVVTHSITPIIRFFGARIALEMVVVSVKINVQGSILPTSQSIVPLTRSRPMSTSRGTGKLDRANADLYSTEPMLGRPTVLQESRCHFSGKQTAMSLPVRRVGLPKSTGHCSGRMLFPTNLDLAETLGNRDLFL